MRTPDPTRKMSKRRFDGQVRVWRRFLHQYDALETDGTEDFTADLAAEAEDRLVLVFKKNTEAATENGSCTSDKRHSEKTHQRVRDRHRARPGQPRPVT